MVGGPKYLDDGGVLVTSCDPPVDPRAGDGGTVERGVIRWHMGGHGL